MMRFHKRAVITDRLARAWVQPRHRYLVGWRAPLVTALGLRWRTDDTFVHKTPPQRLANVA